MFFRKRQHNEENIKAGFAILPITAKNGTVWLERYALLRRWDKLLDGWVNEKVVNLTKEGKK